MAEPVVVKMLVFAAPVAKLAPVLKTAFEIAPLMHAVDAETTCAPVLDTINVNCKPNLGAGNDTVEPLVEFKRITSPDSETLGERELPALLTCVKD